MQGKLWLLCTVKSFQGISTRALDRYLAPNLCWTVGNH